MRHFGLNHGAGLGNQAIQWSKGLAIAEALDAKISIVHPLRSQHASAKELGIGSPTRSLLSAATRTVARAPRRWVYPRNLWESTLDQLPQSVAEARSAYTPSGVTIPIHRNIAGLFLPGRLGIPHLRRFLLGSSEYPAPATTESAFRIAVHLRAGDFSEAAQHPSPGVANQRWPLTWSLDRVLAGVEAARGIGAEPIVQIVSDSQKSADTFALRLEHHVKTSRPLSIEARNGTVLDDLRTIAAASYVVPSASTFSLLALAMGRSLFAWHLGHLESNSTAAWFAPPFSEGHSRIAERLKWSTHPPGQQKRRALAISSELNGSVERSELERRFSAFHSDPPNWTQRTFVDDLATGGLADIIR